MYRYGTRTCTRVGQTIVLLGARLPRGGCLSDGASGEGSGGSNSRRSGSSMEPGHRKLSTYLPPILHPPHDFPALGGRSARPRPSLRLTLSVRVVPMPLTCARVMHKDSRHENEHIVKLFAGFHRLGFMTFSFRVLGLNPVETLKPNP